MVLSIVLFAAAMCLVQRLTFVLRFQPFERTAIWTPGAVLFTALLLAPPRPWWMYYVGLCLGAVGAYFDDGHWNDHWYDRHVHNHHHSWYHGG